MVVRWNELDVELEPIIDHNGVHIGWAVKDVKALIQLHLEEAVRRGEIGLNVDNCELDYKHGGDGLSYCNFKGLNIQCEQWQIYLLVDGQPYNALSRSIPLAFMHDQKEERETMKPLLAHLEPQLPRSGHKFVVKRAGLNDLNITIREDFLMVDYKCAYLVYGHQGQSATYPCVHCRERFGKHRHGDHAVVPDAARCRTMQEIITRGKIAERVHVRCDAAAAAAVAGGDESLVLAARNKAAVDLFFEMNANPPTQLDASLDVAALCSGIRDAPKTEVDMYKMLYSISGEALTMTDVVRYCADACHWHINEANRDFSQHKQDSFFEKHLDQIPAASRSGPFRDYTMKQYIEQELFGGKSRPIQGWDANACVKIIESCDSWLVLFEVSPKSSPINLCPTLLNPQF